MASYRVLGPLDVDPLQETPARLERCNDGEAQVEPLRAHPGLLRGLVVRAGDLLVGKNRFREAVDWYQKADLSKPNDPQINDRLRLALEQVSGGN